jgi:hypothetical protein
MDWDFERIMEVFCGPVGWLRTTSFDMGRMYLFAVHAMYDGTVERGTI